MQCPISRSITLIEDTFDCFGLAVLKCFIKKMENLYDQVLLVLFERPKEAFFENFELTSLSVSILDFYTEPIDSNFSGHLDRITVEFSHLSPRRVLVFDSLASLKWMHDGNIDEICTLLLNRQSWCSLIDVEFEKWCSESTPVLALYHSECFSPVEIDLLRYMADFHCRLFFDDRLAKCACILRSNSGKIAHSTEIFRVTNVYQLTVDKPESCEKLPETDRLSLGTGQFDRQLTDSERKARALVRLPFTNAQRQQGLVGLNIGGNKKVKVAGKIIYQPDDADDFDESDPDDDLMI